MSMSHALVLSAALTMPLTGHAASPRIIDQLEARISSSGKSSVVQILDDGGPRAELRISSEGEPELRYSKLLLGHDYHLRHAWGALGAASELGSRLSLSEGDGVRIEQWGAFTTYDRTHRGDYSRTISIFPSGGKLLLAELRLTLPPTERQAGEHTEIHFISRIARSRILGWRGRGDGPMHYWTLTAGCGADLGAFDRSGPPPCSRWEFRHPKALLRKQMARSRTVAIHRTVNVGCDVHACGAGSRVYDDTIQAIRERCGRLLGTAAPDFIVLRDRSEELRDSGDYVDAVRVDFLAKCVPGESR